MFILLLINRRGRTFNITTETSDVCAVVDTLYSTDTELASDFGFRKTDNVVAMTLCLAFCINSFSSRSEHVHGSIYSDA